MTPSSIDEHKNPWHRLSSLTVYENSWIKVRHEEVIHPSGAQGVYGVVHFKNTAVAVIPLDEQGYTWLVGQYRYPLEQWSWEIPMGGVPEGEQEQQGALRELAEETGIRAAKIDHLMSLHTTNSITDERAEIFVATHLSQGESCPDDSEQLKIKRVSLAECIEMIHRGQITDAISVAGLLRLYCSDPTLNLLRTTDAN